MSAVDIDNGLAPSQLAVPVIEQAIVDQVVAEISNTPLDTVVETNRQQMYESGNWTLAELHRGFVEEGKLSYGLDVARKLSAGYMAGYSILWRSASPEHPLPTFTPEQVDAYAYHATLGNNLRTDVDRDYSRHPAVLKFLGEMLTNQDSKAAAQLLFGLHGKWANPNRSPVFIPNPPLARLQNHARRHSRSARGTSYGQAAATQARFGLNA